MINDEVIWKILNKIKVTSTPPSREILKSKSLVTYVQITKVATVIDMLFLS